MGTEEQRDISASVLNQISPVRCFHTCLDGRAFPLVLGGLLHKQDMSTIIVAAIELLHRGEVYGAVRIDEVASAVNEIDAIDFARRVRIVLSGLKHAKGSHRSNDASEQPYDGC